MSKLVAPSRGISRRRFLTLTGAAALLAGCDDLSRNPAVREFLGRTDELTRGAQRTVLSNDVLAQEFTEADISPYFRANGSTFVSKPEYLRLATNNFTDYRLPIGGLVQHPRSYSLEELRALPARTQITRHDCVEGWSCIGKWKGPPLGDILDVAGVLPDARYVLFRCYDTLGLSEYYESIDLFDAFHPQTILAYEMNDETLPIAHGAPVRARVERQLGYKSAKYIRQIELVASLDGYGNGNGGYWEDRGYEWYAGI